MKTKLRIEEYEYSSKAAQDAAARAREAQQSNTALEVRNQQQGQRIARELSETQAKARQPIRDEAELARALLQFQAATGVKVGIERRRKKVQL